ncbi:thrombin inhibitor hemalin-like [Neocloeon triangulifer]|uniref:thrombin inhibitor hemalin-like n=1 Tax=Neocloeon triangulifer TaxID=2078957 RepID=UPI00286F20D8|nr:thrombin inhibitor hemalin-like [Neocloeon triangulifer]
MLTRQSLLSSALLLFCLLVRTAAATPIPDSGGSSSSNASLEVCLRGPMKEGALIECDAYLPMYTFRAASGECEGFIYGGCGGSENLFATRAECEHACRHLVRERRGLDCGQPTEKGRCLAALHRFAYNPTSRDCDEFVYGGCGGNANNFRTRTECLKKCDPEVAKFKDGDVVPPLDAQIVVEAVD